MTTENIPTRPESENRPNPDEVAILIIRRHDGQSQSIDAARDRCRVAITDNAERVVWLEKESSGAFADGTIQEMRETQGLLDEAMLHGRRLAALLGRLDEEFDRAKANEADATWHAEKQVIDNLGAQLEAMLWNDYRPAAEMIAGTLKLEAQYRATASAYNFKRCGVQDPDLRLTIPELQILTVRGPNTSRGWASYGDAIEALPGVATKDDPRPVAYWTTNRIGWR